MTKREISFLGAGLEIGLAAALLLAGWWLPAIVPIFLAAFILRDVRKPEPK